MSALLVILFYHVTVFSTKIQYAFFVSLILVICPSHRSLHDLIYMYEQY